MKQHIVITGDKGYIGTHLKEMLSITNPDTEISLFDLKDGKDILDVAIPKCDILYHLAAQTSVPDSVKYPLQDAETNIAGTIKVLLENPDARVILAGSVASKDPKSPYGISKLAQELYAQVIHRDVVICRFPNVYGRGDHGVINRFITDEEITIYGDGKQTRDFVHVADICKGLVMAQEWPTGAYELGSGTSHPIINIAEATGKKINFEPAREGDIVESICENTTPNWIPEIDVVDYVMGGMCDKK